MPGTTRVLASVTDCREQMATRVYTSSLTSNHKMMRMNAGSGQEIAGDICHGTIISKLLVRGLQIVLMSYNVARRSVLLKYMPLFLSLFAWFGVWTTDCEGWGRKIASRRHHMCRKTVGASLRFYYTRENSTMLSMASSVVTSSLLPFLPSSS
jgi:hypothetical protein